MPELDSMLQLAEDFLAQGNLAAAEVVCRQILDQDPDQPRVRKILAAILDAAGVRWPIVHDVAGPRYLVAKSWGFGFWSDVMSVLGALLLAEATRRIPIVHWGANSLFGDGSGRDAFRHFFAPPSALTIDDVAALGDADYYPPKWSRHNLAREELSKWNGPYSRLAPLFYVARKEPVIVCDFFVSVVDVLPWLPPDHPLYGRNVVEAYHWLIRKYVHPRPEIVTRCDRFIATHLAGGPFAAAHVRGSDKILEVDNLDAINQSYFSMLDDVAAAMPVFVLTDDQRLLDAFRERYRDRVVATACRRSDSTLGVHHDARVENRVEIGREVMIDTYIALHADMFLGNGGSNVSAMIALMKDWPPKTCILNCPPLVLSRDYYRYVATKQPGK